MPTLAGNVYLAESDSVGRVLTINGTGPLTISGNIANNSGGNTLASGLVYSGAGTLFLSGGANTYTGGTTVNSGSLTFTNTGAIPATGTVTINAAGTLNASGGSRHAGRLAGLRRDRHRVAGSLALTGNDSEAAFAVPGGYTSLMIGRRVD